MYSQLGVALSGSLYCQDSDLIKIGPNVNEESKKSCIPPPNYNNENECTRDIYATASTKKQPSVAIL